MNRLPSLPRAWRMPVLAALLLVGAILLVRWEDLPKATLTPSDLAPFSLEGVKKILILAPHCDDETLGMGGLMQAAVQSNIEVQVVIATNGDGFPFSTLEEFRKIYPTAKDFIRMGEVRQQESLTALEKLGVPADHVYFLGYPDRGTAPLLERYWSSAQPYRSPYSQASKSPYPRTYDRASVYAGEDYLADVESIVEEYRPDLLVFPNPEDVHPDHWGLGAFTRLALARISHRDPMYQPGQITYLVHRPDYPVVRGLKPSAGLVPPPALSSIYSNWLGWDLTIEQVRTKGMALRSYKSQWPLLRSLMESFIRSNELFAPVNAADLPDSILGEPFAPFTWKDLVGKSISAVQLDPTGDVLSHKVARGTDLKALYVTSSPAGELWICAQLHGKAGKEFRYTLRLKALTQNGIVSFEARTRPGAGQAAVTRSGDYFCTQTSLAGLGDPWAILLEATVESPDPLLPLDQTAWQMVYLR